MGDVTVEEAKPEESVPKAQSEPSNEEAEQQEATPQPLGVSAVEVTSKKETSENKTEEKQNKLKNDIFYIEFVDGKSKVEDAPGSNSPKEVSTPRRVNKLRDHSSNIFPAGCMGCREDPPSDHIASPRRFLDPIEAKDRVGHIDITPRKRPSSAKPTTLPRNPLTGVGVLDEEVKKTFGRRKDGNPLLGEGYETKEVTPSCTRIPPGGYSQGLW